MSDTPIVPDPPAMFGPAEAVGASWPPQPATTSATSTIATAVRRSVWGFVRIMLRSLGT
jgi:hypothetical protein